MPHAADAVRQYQSAAQIDRQVRAPPEGLEEGPFRRYPVEDRGGLRIASQNGPRDDLCRATPDELPLHRVLRGGALRRIVACLVLPVARRAALGCRVAGRVTVEGVVAGRRIVDALCAVRGIVRDGRRNVASLHAGAGRSRAAKEEAGQERPPWTLPAQKANLHVIDGPNWQFQALTACARGTRTNNTADVVAATPASEN